MDVRRGRARRALGLGIVGVAALALAAAGCNDRNKRFAVVVEVTTDNFPGGTVQANNLADDGRAFSINGQSVLAGSLKCVRNGVTGEAIVLFGTIQGGRGVSVVGRPSTVAPAAIAGNGEIHLWASHFDGQTFTQPVELLGVDFDPFSAPEFGTIIVAFYNTAGFAASNNQAINAAVQARAGDAVILWKRRDFTIEDPIGNAADTAGQNTRLYYTYFDRTFRGDQFAIEDVRDAGPEIVQNGFTETAQILDVLDEGDNSNDDQLAEDVQAAGIISDGLCGTARWFDQNVEGQLTNFFSFGEAVTHIVAFWVQNDDAEDLDNDGTETDDELADSHLFTNILDLATGAFEGAQEDVVGLAGAQGSNAGLTRGDTFVNPDVIVSHDNIGINQYFEQEDALDVVLVAISATVNAADGIPDLADAEISPAHDGTDDVEEQSFPITFLAAEVDDGDFFGGDDGLDALFVFYISDTDTDLVLGTDNDEADVFVSRVPADAADFVAASDIEQLSTDTDNAGGGADVIAGSLRAVVNRTGDFVAVVWRQGAPTVIDADNDVSLFGTVVRDGAVNDLDKGVPGGQVHPDTLLSDQTNGQDDDVFAAEFQQDTGFLCGIQSDLEVLNVLFFQEEDSGQVGDEDELHCTAIGTDLDVDDESDGVNLGSVLVEVFVDQELEQRLVAGVDVRAVDAGANGEVLFVFLRDGDGVLDDGDGIRLFAAEVDARNGEVDGPEVVSTDLDVNDARAIDAIEVTPRPVNAVGNFAAQRIDVIFNAERGDSPLDTNAILHRSYDATDANDVNGVLFENRFNPDLLADAPFEIDTHEHNDAFFVSASTLAGITGVYLIQDGHAYYNQFNGVTWIEENGDIEPQIIDNDSGLDLDGGGGGKEVIFEIRDGQVAPGILVDAGDVAAFLLCEVDCGTCDTLGGGFSFFARFGGQTSDDDFRFFVRVRDND